MYRVGNFQFPWARAGSHDDVYSPRVRGSYTFSWAFESWQFRLFFFCLIELNRLIKNVMIVSETFFSHVRINIKNYYYEFLQKKLHKVAGPLSLSQTPHKSELLFDRVVRD